MGDVQRFSGSQPGKCIFEWQKDPDSNNTESDDQHPRLSSDHHMCLSVHMHVYAHTLQQSNKSKWKMKTRINERSGDGERSSGKGERDKIVREEGNDWNTSHVLQKCHENPLTLDSWCMLIKIKVTGFFCMSHFFHWNSHNYLFIHSNAYSYWVLLKIKNAFDCLGS